MEKVRTIRWGRVWKAIALLLFVTGCLGSVTLLVLADQTTIVGLAYLRAVNAGNAGAAELLGDHFSDNRSWQRSLYAQDVQRDISYLQGAELADVTATREQTLSGQWATIVRFKWREAGSSGGWAAGGLRVKTGSWLVFTYIRTVELVR